MTVMETPVPPKRKHRAVRESHRLRITLAHRRRTLKDAEVRVENLKADIAQIEADIKVAASIESKAMSS